MIYFNNLNLFVRFSLLCVADVNFSVTSYTFRHGPEELICTKKYLVYEEHRFYKLISGTEIYFFFFLFSCYIRVQVYSKRQYLIYVNARSNGTSWKSGVPRVLGPKAKNGSVVSPFVGMIHLPGINLGTTKMDAVLFCFSFRN